MLRLFAAILQERVHTLNSKENYLRTVFFERPYYIPMSVGINAACWNSYPQEFLCEQMEKHTKLFPVYVQRYMGYFD